MNVLTNRTTGRIYTGVTFSSYAILYRESDMSRISVIDTRMLVRVEEMVRSEY